MVRNLSSVGCNQLSRDHCKTVWLLLPIWPHLGRFFSYSLSFPLNTSLSASMHNNHGESGKWEDTHSHVAIQPIKQKKEKHKNERKKTTGSARKKHRKHNSKKKEQIKKKKTSIKNQNNEIKNTKNLKSKAKKKQKTNKLTDFLVKMKLRHRRGKRHTLARLWPAKKTPQERGVGVKLCWKNTRTPSRHPRHEAMQMQISKKTKLSYKNCAIPSVKRVWM